MYDDIAMYDDVDSIKLPPHSIDAEQSILGGLLVISRAFSAGEDNMAVFCLKVFYCLINRI